MCSIGYANAAGEEVSEEEAEGAAPELSDEQTSQLADLYDQLAAGEGPLSSEEGAAMAGGIEDIVGPEAAGEGAAAAAEFPEEGFKDSQSLADYMSAKYPDTQFDFKGLDIDALNPAMRQFEKVVDDFPYITDHLEYIGGLLGDGAPAMTFDGDPLAQAFGSKYIGLNPEYWENAAKTSASFASESETFSSVPTRSFEFVMSHELGHTVEMSLPSSLEDTPEANELGTQMYNLLYGNRYPKVSDYARKNLGEQWAESFASLSPASSLSP